MSVVSRLAVYNDLITEQANFGIALDIHAFVFAQFGFAGGEQGAVVHVGWNGVAGQEGEVGFVATLAVEVHAVAPGPEISAWRGGRLW